MMLESLRREVLKANQEIARRGLAPHTFGNASGVDRSGREPLVVIKPSGVDYVTMKPEDLVITDLNGKIVEGSLNPSSDLDTHTLLYREFPQIGEGLLHRGFQLVHIGGDGRQLGHRRVQPQQPDGCVREEIKRHIEQAGDKTLHA